MSYFILTQSNGACLSGVEDTHSDRIIASSFNFSDDIEEAMEFGYLEAINTMNAFRRIGFTLYVAEVYGGGEMWMLAAVPGQISPPWLASDRAATRRERGN